MGRVSRYKKIKSCDPFFKGPRKDIRLDPSWNKPPSKNDILMEPKMPRLARELFRTELELPNTTNKKKPKKKEKKKATTAMFQQAPGESKRDYFRRIHHETTMKVAECLRKSRPMREGRKRYLKERKQKIKDKKNRAKEDSNFDFKKDHVRFGEVVKEPPSLTAKPRKASSLTNKGTKQLLLHSQIAQEAKTGSQADVKTVKTKGLTVPKTKKRKHMSSLEREKADKAREHAIMAYRTMRKKQLQQKNKSM